ncbi:MAG: galactokinase [Thermoleophilia bacterium]|nr:galactokinase [Thermoleophilia bacterium]
MAAPGADARRRLTSFLSFEQLFGRPPDAVAAAPGRVNLIGEHTDYNEGYVLPTPIPLQTAAEMARKPGDVVTVVSATLDETTSYRLGEEQRTARWIDYIQGLTRVLRESGHRLSGFDLRVDSQVPAGSGLSSSAALEIAVLRALREAFSLHLDDAMLAKLGQRAEIDHVGAPVGLMDQMASSLGRQGEALFLDMRTLTAEPVPMPDSVELMVIGSGVRHDNASGGYAERRAECRRAAELLRVAQLRDADLAMLRSAHLPHPLDRRARHVITENVRVVETVAALRRGDLEGVAAAFAASHASMRDDFEISVPEVDMLVALAEAEPTVHGARLTGGGFGGAMVALADRGTGLETAASIIAKYGTAGRGRPRVLLPR